jgi:hypothetical protein
MNSFQFNIDDKTIIVNVAFSCGEMDTNEFKKKLEDPLIQFILLAAVQNKGKIELSTMLFWVNRFYSSVDAIDWERQKVLRCFGKYAASTKVFEIDLDLFERYKHLITYDRPVISDVSNYHIAYFLVKLLAFVVGYIFWRDVTIVILVFYLSIKFYNILMKT